MTKGPTSVDIVTPHIKWSELACKDASRTPYPEHWRVSRALPLAVEFERIRAAVGKPVVVASAYRTKTYNASVGGARHSQHVQGRALDLIPPKGWNVDRFFAVVRAVASQAESAIYGLGRYPTFVHIDIRPPRPDGRLTIWRGTRAWAEVK